MEETRHPAVTVHAVMDMVILLVAVCFGVNPITF